MLNKKGRVLNQKKIHNSFESPTGAFQAMWALSKTFSTSHQSWYFVYSIYKTTSRELVGPGHSLLTPGIPHLSFSNFVNELNAVIRAVTLQIDPGSEYMKAKRHRSFGIGGKAPQKTFGWRNKEELSVRFCWSSTRHRTRSTTDSNFCKKKVFTRAHWNVP